jgi:hypothetical protein
MSEKKTSALALKAAEKARKVLESENLGRAAIVESAKIRARFDAGAALWCHHRTELIA